MFLEKPNEMLAKDIKIYISIRATQTMKKGVIQMSQNKEVRELVSVIIVNWK